MEELLIEHLVKDGENGESVWTTYKYSFSPETDFHIDTENLDGEICGVGILLNSYGDAHARLQAQVERHKREVELVYSQIYLEYREMLVKANEKAPDAIIKAHCVINDEYQTVVNKFIETQRQAIRADGWWKSAMKKADLVQALAYKLSSEIKRGAY